METISRGTPRRSILVDNGSDDGGPDAIAAAFPHVTVLRLEENRGAAARNVGVRLARTPYRRVRRRRLLLGRPARSRDAAAVAGRACRGSALLTGTGAGRSGGPRSDPVSRRPWPPHRSASPTVHPVRPCWASWPAPSWSGASLSSRPAGFEPRLHVYGEEALLAMDLAAAGRQLVVRAGTDRAAPAAAGRAATTGARTPHRGPQPGADRRCCAVRPPWWLGTTVAGLCVTTPVRCGRRGPPAAVGAAGTPSAAGAGGVRPGGPGRLRSGRAASGPAATDVKMLRP